MRRLAMFWLAILMAVGVAPSRIGAVPAASRPDAPASAGVGRLAPDLAPHAGSGPLDVVVTLDHVAGPELTRALRDLDLTAWIGSHVAVARVRIMTRDLRKLRRIEGVRAVYPNRILPRVAVARSSALGLLAAPSTAASPSDGPTGKGVTIAVVDTGVDGTHPDLRPAMVANVKFPADPVAPIEGLDNTDATSGHGTLVAGTAAGRGFASDGRYRGAAPGASLVGVGLGELGSGFTTFAVTRAYDWILEHRKQYGIRVVNNSYARDFDVFDPDDPVNRATRSAADAGIAVVFGMGNSGGESDMNGYATAPWVIAVGATTAAGQVSDFSSEGIEADVMGDDFSDRLIRGETRSPLHMGLYHPSVVTLGEDIIGPRATTAPPDLPSDPTDPGKQVFYRTASGTSVSTPLAAGVIARVLEANPTLGPEDVRRVLQVTARPIQNVPFHRQGYGQVDPAAAVALALSLADKPPTRISQDLEVRQRARDTELLHSFAQPLETRISHRPSVNGPFSERIPVGPGTSRIKVVTTRGAVVQEPGPTLTIRVLDATGHEVARRMRRAETGSPATVLEVDLTAVSNARWGQWTVEITNGEPSPSLIPVPTEIAVIATFA